MARSLKSLAAAGFAAAIAGCTMSHGPGGVAYSTQDKPAVGVTEDTAGGTVSGTAGNPTGKEQRGNTPPGSDRDGHGPAAGAIVDPTGAATRGTPY
jgi:hypothetical protein